MTCCGCPTVVQNSSVNKPPLNMLMDINYSACLQEPPKSLSIVKKHISQVTTLCGHNVCLHAFCGELQGLHYTTEVMVQTVLFVQLNYLLCLCNKVLFLEVGHGCTRMSGYTPVPCAQQLAHCSIPHFPSLCLIEITHYT